MKKLFNYSQYQAINEASEISDLINSKLDIGMLGMVFDGLDVEKVIVNSAQIISVIVSFFGKFGMRVSLTLETLLLLYWLYKYETAESAVVKEDAMTQMIFSAVGFAILGALPAFKLISKMFANGYKEYKVTGSVAKITNAPYFKQLQKHEMELKKAFGMVDDKLAKGLDKLPDNFVKNSTKSEIKETSKGLKKYIDDIFSKESKATKVESKVFKKVKKPSKFSKLGKIAKLGKRLYPLASYLFSRFLKKKKKPSHLEDVNSDIVILTYNNKIIGAEYPEDLKLSEDVKVKKNGKVEASIVALKVLVEDIEKRDFFRKMNVISSIDDDSEYYLACAVNGDPILGNVLFFSVQDGKIMISSVKKGKNDINLVSPTTLFDYSFKLLSYEDSDKITKQNYDKVISVYEQNQSLTNSYSMWSKIIEETFTMSWWTKNFKIKE